MSDETKKIALITGANKGIGLETARQLGKLGITVLVGARDEAKGEAAVAELKKDGVDARAVKLDVDNSADYEAVRKLIEATGGKLVSFYFTTGESDFLLVAEADDAESLLAALMATAAAGMISDVTTARAWTGAEFKSVATKASKAATAYRPPGKR